MAPVLNRPEGLPLKQEDNYVSVTNINQQKCITDHSKGSPDSRSKSIKGNKGIPLVSKRAGGLKDRNISTHMT